MTFLMYQNRSKLEKARLHSKSMKPNPKLSTLSDDGFNKADINMLLSTMTYVIGPPKHEEFSF